MEPWPSRVRILAALALMAVTTFPSRSAAQDGGAVDPESLPRPEWHLTPSSGIHIDGRMDEAAWKDVAPITDFVQSEPETGAPASERTEVRITYDRNYLYVGAEMYDSDPDGLVLGGLERDSPGILFEEMDAFGLTLDTFLDRRSSFIFFVNPAGAVKDGQGTDDGRARDYGWDGVVDVRTTVHERGWTMEMAIPWRTLRFDPTLPEQRWGMNVMRRIRRKNEVSYWAPLDRRNRIFLMSKAGTVTGMGRLPAARNLSVKPFALASSSRNDALEVDPRSNHADGGVDLKWGITPSLTMDLTWRTDFSQVEVDQEQVNLTRFPVFFPELREFFLENSGTFAFGDMDGGPGGPRLGSSLRDLTLFHSRQIGLRGGNPVPLLGGARLTGRAGDFELGVLDVQSQADAGLPAENFSVLRVRRSVFRSSDVGFIVTNRSPTGVGDGVGNLAAGVDANLRVFGRLFVNTYVAGTRDTGGERDHAARLSVGWRDRLWNTSAAVRRVGESFDPGIGFVRRRAIRERYATVGIHPQPGIPHVLEVNPYLETTYTTDLGGRLESRESQAGFGVSFDDRSSLSLTWSRRFERLDAPFQVRAGTSIPVGDYGFGEGSASYRSSQGHALSFNAGVSGGGYYDGSRFTLTGGVRWQPDRHLVLDADATHNGVTAQGDSFSADLYAARVQYAVSTTLNFSGFVQYNAAAEEVVTNLRADLIHAPLSDLFVLYTERRSTAGIGVMERYFTVKVTRLMIF
jgi:hypothetical protein